MGKGGNLGELEEKILLAVLHLRGKGYGVTIQELIHERTGREISLGALYATLTRLEDKGYITSWKGESTPERGGRAKRYFEVQAPGIRVLTASRHESENMWAGAPIPEGVG